MPTYQAEAVLDDRAEHAEGPLWDDVRQELLWVDLYAGLVRRAGWSSDGLDVIATHGLGQAVGAVVPCASPDDGWVVASEFGFARLGVDGSVRALAEPERANGGRTRMNDGCCDPLGRMWAGSMAHDRTPGAGSLYRLDGDRAERVLDDVTISNGIAWRDPESFHYVDTPTRRVDLVEVDPDGRLVGRRTAFGIAPSLGAPDGMAVDAEGCLWVALWGGSAVVRFSPSGEVLARVDVPATQVSSCCFGGPDLSVLFVTTSREGFTPERSAAEPHAGKVFAVRTGVAGLPADRFAVSGS
ncbi:SMP-30/gluconolactonase/LRE family protein [Umezawaea endophytica]|uniref:SMP-30/gluconolactonase/LRE family protein n=1 Tax=Umezawaea endophytica TaxID=1654476 RepID=A0A9X2VFG5_9PSEU|nr:SMP-30/gluconolactonase/LRE family protein [Umezawaea endophytica]MCS7475631.1 SMP-30/gluconolactonase/LRE family protein [Umezawaea endophytica]